MTAYFPFYEAETPGGCAPEEGATRAPVIAARGNDDVVDVEFEDVKK